MKKSTFALVLFLCLVLGSTAASAVQVGHGPQPGQVLPDPVLEPSPFECDLLGVCGQGDLRLSGLPGRFLLVQVFSMYCPHCQAAAPSVNTVYHSLMKSGHADEMTMVGLGAGNSRYEVDFFREQFHVPFALFPDQDMTFYACLDKPGTPFFIVLEKTDQGLTVRYTHQGPFGDPDEFLEELFAAAGLKP